MRLKLPQLALIDKKVHSNIIIQVGIPVKTVDGTIEAFQYKLSRGYIFRNESGSLVILHKGNVTPDEYELVLKCKEDFFNEAEDNAEIDLTNSKWVKHPLLDADHSDNEQIFQSWEESFSFTTADKKLREPQIGALHALHAHWSSSDEVATIVMPTGTGKTETMLSAMVSNQCEKIIVVVPTDALRTQISDKFISLGILGELGIIDEETIFYPKVCILRKRPRNVEEITEILNESNVLVTTMSVVGQSPENVQERIAGQCSHLFIDEAHHSEADTWKKFKDKFDNNKIVQFTATPSRNDNKPLGGKIIFNYPLKRAQAKGYFRPITFRPIVEFNPERADERIAEQAVAQLRADLAQGRNHILMARVSDIPRANEVAQIYSQYQEFNPVEIHTGIKSVSERNAIKEQLLSGASRIVICVDMLGEGFDLPELKIAALHDVRKSLPITLQLVGRFTRSRDDLGDPTVVANIAEVDMKEGLRDLYRNDVDWNRLLPFYADRAIREEFELYEFLGGFRRFPDDISLQNIKPAMSTVIYTTGPNWTPENFKAGIKGYDHLDKCYFDINNQQDTLVIVTTKRVFVEWAQISDIYTWDWQLYIIYWDRRQRLLFIHNSENAGFFGDLAKAVAGQDVQLIKGRNMFRCFASINRLKLQNAGLLEHFGKYVRFTMRAGSDVASAITAAERQRVQRSNIFANGFENGSKTTMGCSYKGRVWSWRKTNVKAFTSWCSKVGAKIIDPNINGDEILEGTLIPESVGSRPDSMPLNVDWPEDFYKETTHKYKFLINGQQYYLHEVDLRLHEPAEEGNLSFEINAGPNVTVFSQTMSESEEGFDFIVSAEAGTVDLQVGNQTIPANEYFKSNPLTFWFANGASLTGNELIRLRSGLAPFSADNIEAWDWSGVNIRNESQHFPKERDSIQYKVIQDLVRSEDYTLVFNDDGQGEMADVVAVREDDESITLEVYHCKFSSEDNPGARVADLYEVCGQAQKTVRWMENPESMFVHLLKREPGRYDNQDFSRYELGDEENLIRLREKSRVVKVDVKAFIVQPGVSKSRVSVTQQNLLAIAENYLMSTYLIPLKLISSE